MTIVYHHGHMVILFCWQLVLLFKTDRIETHSSLFGGKVLTDEKSHDFFNVPKLHPTHRWKRLLPISVSVPS
jgi:hypothetical protein